MAYPAGLELDRPPVRKLPVRLPAAELQRAQAAEVARGGHELHGEGAVDDQVVQRLQPGRMRRPAGIWQGFEWPTVVACGRSEVPLLEHA